MDDEGSLVEAVQQRFCTKDVPQVYIEYCNVLITSQVLKHPLL